MGKRGRECVLCLVQRLAHDIAQFGRYRRRWIGSILGSSRHTQNFVRRYLALVAGEPIAASPAPGSFQNAFPCKSLEHALAACTSAGRWTTERAEEWWREHAGGIAASREAPHREQETLLAGH